MVEREWGSQARSARSTSSSSLLSRERCPSHRHLPVVPSSARDRRAPKSPLPLPSVPPRSRPEPSAPYCPEPGSNRHTNGEFWWRLALEKHMGKASAMSQTIPWEALCRHSLATFFLEVLGDEGHDRPLLVRGRRGFGADACSAFTVLEAGGQASCTSFSED